MSLILTILAFGALAYVAWQLRTEVVEITMACWCQLRFRTMLALRILHNNLSTPRRTGAAAAPHPSQHNFAKASSFHMYVVHRVIHFWI